MLKPVYACQNSISTKRNLNMLLKLVFTLFGIYWQGWGKLLCYSIGFLPKTLLMVLLSYFIFTFFCCKF